MGWLKMLKPVFRNVPVKNERTLTWKIDSHDVYKRYKS